MIVISIGIYKITNIENNKCYIGQSKHIEKRWCEHINESKLTHRKCSYYPLYIDMRLYGLDAFRFEIVEMCSEDNLIDKECYWIGYYKPEYNQTIGEYFRSIPQKLTDDTVCQIQKILIEDSNYSMSNKEIGDMFGVHRDTIQYINSGFLWNNSKLKYPLRDYDKYIKDIQDKNNSCFCSLCGKKISFKSTTGLCQECLHNSLRSDVSHLPVTRNELKFLIRTKPFVQIGEMFNVSDNAIRKWCDKFNLPRKSTVISNISDEDWEKI